MFTQLGPYRVLKERASGHRPVFEAIDQIYHRKVFLNECPGNVPVEDILQRVDDGGRVFTALNHPNIARVFGFVRRNDRVYLVTEWVEGATLQEILDARGTMPVEMAMTLFRQVMAGIASAHALGVVHGDLKPENVAVPDFGPIKILDLAFQHVFRVDAPTLEGANHRYLSPEQLQGQPADVRSDIYSLGLMLYETVVGRTPFDPYGSLDANVRVEVIPISPALLRDDHSTMAGCTTAGDDCSGSRESVSISGTRDTAYGFTFQCLPCAKANTAFR